MKKLTFIICILAFLMMGFQKNAQAQKIALNGSWQFAVDPTDKGISEAWYNLVLKDQIMNVSFFMDNFLILNCLNQ